MSLRFETFPCQVKTPQIKNPPKIVVIGAGLAGLTTAYRLQAAGMDVDLYEARNRVGGRVLTASLNDQIVELGAQVFTNPLRHPHLCHLIKEFDLEIVHNPTPLNYSYFDGKNFISMSELVENLQVDASTLSKRLNELNAKASNMKEVLEHFLDKDSPFAKMMNMKLGMYEGAAPENLSTHYLEILSYFLTQALSLKGQKDSEGYVNRSSILGGNRLLPEKIGSELGHRLKLSHTLKQVSRDVLGTFILTFENDHKIHADVLVLAMPCSVYKKIEFDKRVIPKQKLEQIRAVKYGSNSKILIPLDAAKTKSLAFMNDQIYGNYEGTRRILTLNFIDEKNENLEEKFADVCASAQTMLEKRFGPLFFNAPLNAKDQNCANYDSSIGYSWINDPFAQGSYSYVSPGDELALLSLIEKNNELFKKLFEPIENVYFAGEHASIAFEVPGTMEAACESGERIARTILKTHKNF